VRAGGGALPADRRKPVKAAEFVELGETGFERDPNPRPLTAAVIVPTIENA
jgi:hypothetical protein